MECTACSAKKAQATKLQQLKTASSALGRVAIGLVRNREVFSDEEMAKERMRLCLRCEYLDNPTKKCLVCGCFLKLKVILKEEKCPVNRWKPITG